MRASRGSLAGLRPGADIERCTVEGCRLANRGMPIGCCAVMPSLLLMAESAADAFRRNNISSTDACDGCKFGIRGRPVVVRGEEQAN